MTATLPKPLRRFLLTCLLGLAPLATAGMAGASTVPTGFVDEAMATSLNQPVGLCGVPDPGVANLRVLFVEQVTARVGLIVGTTVTTVGTVPSVTTDSGERGLLGITVDPGWPSRPYIYIHCTDGRSGHTIAISRFTLTGDLAFTGSGQLTFDAATRYDLIASMPDNAVNHNGGTVRFGPDGKLYDSIGDDATGCPALDPRVLAGKILRFDVSRLPSGPGGPAPIAILAPTDNPFIAMADSNAKLVYTVGLRNPFRFQVDPATGALFIGDVGENTTEELDRVPGGGMDMGWPLFEGPNSFATCSITPPSPPVDPIASYNHSEGNIIISGGPYRYAETSGRSYTPDYDGDCFFLDYTQGFLRRLKFDGTNWVTPAAVPGQPSSTNWGTGFTNVSDMLELSDGSVWYVRQSPGEVRRISRVVVPSSVMPPGGTVLAFALPHPNPARGSVTLEWTQPKRDRVSLAIYDLGGRCVATLVDGVGQDPGAHQGDWNGRGAGGEAVVPGVYYARLTVGQTTLERAIVRLR